MSLQVQSIQSYQPTHFYSKCRIPTRKSAPFDKNTHDAGIY